MNPPPATSPLPPPPPLPPTPPAGSAAPPAPPAPSPRESQAAAPANTREPLRPGTEVGGYTIISKLGQGGFGITYRARHTADGTIVVLKEHMPEGLSLRVPGTTLITSTSPEAEKRFLATQEEFIEEVTILKGLEHPGVVPIIAGFEANGTAYYVMPFVEGEPLRLPDQPTLDNARKAAEARRLKQQLASLLLTLEYLEQHNIVHRDIKPENIVVTPEGRPILLDFGSARQLQQGKVFTNIYTPDFCAPEQATARTDAAMSEQIGPWTDIYSLGATFYYLITRLLPPKADLRTLADPDPYKPLAGRADLEEHYSHHFLQGLDRALELDPRERWRDAASWRTSIEDGTLPPTPALVRRMRVVLGSAIVILLICGFFTLWALKEKEQAVQIYNNSLRFTEAMLYGFNEELGDVPGATQLQQQMGTNLKNYLNSMEKLPVARDEKLQRALAAAWQNLGATHVQQGDLVSATEAYRKATDMLLDLHEKDPGNMRFRHELARTWLSRAEIARRRNKDEAAKALVSQSMTLLRQLCKDAPDNPEYRCTLGAAIGYRASMANASGNETLRKESLDEMLALYRDLATAYPRHEEARKGLGYALQFRGRMAMDQQDFATALYLLNEARDIFTELTGLHPYKLSFRMGLATTYFSIGSMYRQMGLESDDEQITSACDDDAMNDLRQCIKLAKELEAMDAHNAGYPALRGGAMASMIEIHLHRKEVHQAMALSNSLLRLAEELLDAAPKNADYLRLKARALRGLALSHSQSEKSYTQATGEFEQYRQIAAALMTENKGTPSLKYMYADALDLSARHAETTGDAVSARLWLEEALPLLTEITRQAPENTLWARHLAELKKHLKELPQDEEPQQQ